VSLVFTQEDTTALAIPVNVFTDSNVTHLSDIPFTLQDAKKQLDKIRIDKAAGADGLSSRLLTKVKDEICYPLFF